MMAKYEKGTFSIVPNMNAVRHMSAATVVVYVVLCKFADEKGKCFPSASTIVEWSGVGRRQIFNCLNSLEELGLIERISGGEGKSNQYQILLVSENALVQKRTRGSAKTDTGTSAKTDTLTIPDELYQLTKPIAQDKPVRKFSQKGTEIIKALEEIDKKNSKYYVNTTQREACDFLIETYSLERVLAVIAGLKITNTIPYFPVITTPVQLRDRWTELESKATKWKLQKKTEKEKYQVI